MIKKIYKIKNLDCPSCATNLECDLEDCGISAKCSYTKSCLTAEIENDSQEKQLIETVKKANLQLE